MSQTINTNVLTMTAQRNLSRSAMSMATAMERLSSGLRINSAKDDAAGLAISERMNAQVRGMQVAIRNANDGISLAQTAEGGLNEMSSMLQRMRELAIQAMNGTNTTGDRANLDLEYQQLATELTRITDVTQFNGSDVLGAASTFNFQVGANTGQTLAVSTVDVAAGSGIASAIAENVASAGSAEDAVTAIDIAIATITTQRATYGAIQSRFQSAINNLQIGLENQSAARGRIVDADFAVETAALTRAQILQQAGNAMVAQANASPQSVLQLLG